MRWVVFLHHRKTKLGLLRMHKIILTTKTEPYTVNPQAIWKVNNYNYKIHWAIPRYNCELWKKAASWHMFKVICIKKFLQSDTVYITWTEHPTHRHVILYSADLTGLLHQTGLADMRRQINTSHEDIKSFVSPESRHAFMVAHYHSTSICSNEPGQCAANRFLHIWSVSSKVWSFCLTRCSHKSTV